MCLRVGYKKKKKKNFLESLSHWRKVSDPELDPDPYPLVKSMAPRIQIPIRIRTKCHGSPTLRPILYLVNGFSKQMYCNTCVENIKYSS